MAFWLGVSVTAQLMLFSPLSLYRTAFCPPFSFTFSPYFPHNLLPHPSLPSSSLSLPFQPCISPPLNSPSCLLFSSPVFSQSWRTSGWRTGCGQCASWPLWHWDGRRLKLRPTSPGTLCFYQVICVCDQCPPCACVFSSLHVLMWHGPFTAHINYYVCAFPLPAPACSIMITEAAVEIEGCHVTEMWLASHKHT